MTKILNILLFIIFFLLFSFLIFSTFFVPQYKSVEEVSSLDFKSGIFSLNLGDDSSVIEKELAEESEEEKAFVYKINYLDNLYFDRSESYSFSLSGSLGIIDLKKPGVFLLDINDLSRKYKIHHKGFMIEPLSIGRIFIDTNDSTEILVLSQDSSYSLSFKDVRTASVLTKSYFFPHQFIKFNPLKNVSLKNADFLRVTTVSSAGYIKNKFFDDSSISDSLSRLVSLGSIDFLNIVFKDINSRNTLNIKDYNELKSISLREFPGKDMIEKYISFFYNDSKKIVYYKNNILILIDDLFRSKAYEKSKIDDLVLYLNNLREIDSEEYNNMLRIINYYDKVISLNNTTNSIESKLNFSYLKNSLKGIEYKIYKNISLIYLKYLYCIFDFGNTDFPLKDFDLFVNTFLESLSVDIEDNKISVSDIDNSLFIDYFTYFFKNLLTSNLSLKQDSNIQDLDSNLKLINKYMILNDFIYFNDNSDLRKKTGLYENLEFAKKLSVFLRLNFFEKDRSQQGLLVLKSANSIITESSRFLEKNIEKIIDNFENYKELIINREKDIIDYEKIKLEFPEYFLALFSYDKYSLEYDIIKKSLLDIETANEAEIDNLTEKDFIDYISDFNGLDLSNLGVEVVENYYFEISNLLINGLSFSFSLYPYDSNTIEDIVISGNGIIDDKERIKIGRSSYNLDFIKESLDKKIMEYTGENKDKYDFKNFFINTFFTANEDDIADYSSNDDNNNLEEDKFVVVFKKNKLLSDSGEFSTVRDMLDINYNDIKVTRTGNNYEIYLGEVLFTVDLNDSSKKRFNGEFSSDYTLTSENHDFENIKLKVYDRFTENGGTEFLIGGNYINFVGKITISEIEEKMYSFFENFNSIFMVYDNLKSKFDIEDIDIEYYVFDDKTKFSLNYDNNILVIQLDGNEVEYISFSGKNIASNLNLVKLGLALDIIKN